MATSTPGRASATPTLDQPAAPRRTRKPSAKVLEVQQSLGARTRALRSAQNEASTIVVHPTQHEPPPSATQSTQHGLTPFPTARVSISSEHTGGSTEFEQVVELIRGLKETIAKQSGIIESVKTELTAVKEEQGYLKSQNAELQKNFRSL